MKEEQGLSILIASCSFFYLRFNDDKQTKGSSKYKGFTGTTYFATRIASVYRSETVAFIKKRMQLNTAKVNNFIFG